MVRDWRQRFDPAANLVWRRTANWDGVTQNVGDPIPADLRGWLNKLRVLWDTGYIELGPKPKPKPKPKRRA